MQIALQARQGDSFPGLTLQVFLSGHPHNHMKLIAFNGSPWKRWNTATLLKHTIEGAESAGAKTELFHLYDLEFRGCTSCFACKRLGGKNYGHCAVKDI